MSRVFEALQRSGTEQSGIEYPDMMSIATQVFEAPQQQGSDAAVSGEMAAEIAATHAEPDLLPQILTLEKQAPAPAEFPSLQVAVTPSSRLVFFTEPDSLAAEKFRFLGVRLRQFRQGRTLKKVLVTSTIPQEGKSLVAANLAGVLAGRKERVVLLEGDLRRPMLAQQFGLGHLAGLGEWLENGQGTISNIYRLGGPDFWLMPAGHPPANPLELMQSGRLSQLMEQLSSLFDWIIVDSPPLLPLADTTVWARLTDGVILVTREGKTEKGRLQRGLELLKTSDLLGVVLNSCTNPDQKDYYHHYKPQETK